MFDWVLSIPRGAQGDGLITLFSLSIPALAYLAYIYMQVWREYQVCHQPQLTSQTEYLRTVRQSVRRPTWLPAYGRESSHQMAARVGRT